MSDLETIYIRTPLRILDGIPIFSKMDDYIANYDLIARDHLICVDQGKGNPFVKPEQIAEGQASTRALVIRHVVAGSRVLDAGVGLGELLKPFNQFERHGIDISVSYLKRARSNGFRVAQSRIEDMPFPDGYFDAVVACDVLEHVLRLDDSVDQILRVLKPGGMLILQVPNEEALDSYLNDEKDYEFVHVRAFSLQSLHLYFGRVRGLEYIEHKFSGYQFGGVERLNVKLPQVKSSLRVFLAEHNEGMAELEGLRHGLAVSEEELVDVLSSLQVRSPELYRRLLRHLVKPAEVTIVFRKPVIGDAFSIKSATPAKADNKLSIGRTRQTSLPWQGLRQKRKRMEEFLLICCYDPLGISTVPETVAFVQSQSKFSFVVLNMFEHRQDSGFLKLKPAVNIDRFVGVVIHNSVSYDVNNVRSLDISLARRFKDFSGIKVLMKQDENFHCREMARYIGETGFDIVFTCLPDDEIAKVYPVVEIGTHTRFVRMLTGYVTPTLRTIHPFASERPIDIGYRGSIQPLSFGWLAYEKRKIGEDVSKLLESCGLSVDIASRWENRIGGDGWFDFLLSCKATLGTESGASIFDLSGDLDARCRKAEHKLGPWREDRDYAEAFLTELADLEGKVYYNQISPRHFDAAATGTLQLLYPGEYSGILRSERHYFPLQRDYSNLEEAVEVIMDERRRTELTKTAYEEVVQNRDWWIETFVKGFDGHLELALQAKGLYRRPAVRTARRARNVLMIAAHDPGVDPRLDWVEAGAPADMLIHRIGVLAKESSHRFERSPRGALSIGYPRVTYSQGLCEKWFAGSTLNDAGMAGVNELRFLEGALAMQEERFCELFGAPLGCERLQAIRWYLQHILDSTATLVEAAEGMRGVSALLAVDLNALAAGLILKGMLNVPLFYDAHEYWPEADILSFEFEKQLWVGMERRLVRYADYRQTVSPGLAELMSKDYGCKFFCVPNAELRDRAISIGDTHHLSMSTCRFLFQGAFAVNRGIDQLIKAWPDTDKRSILVLRGPDNECKREMVELARGTGLLGSRILFLEPIAESELVPACGDGEVGLIPYRALGKNYTFCCPNKLSQYMAAGLPILANETFFVSDVIRSAVCGRAVDFSRQGALVKIINELTSNCELRNELGRNAYNYFLSEFNWEAVSKGFYAELEAHVGNGSCEELLVYRSINGGHGMCRQVSEENLAQPPGHGELINDYQELMNTHVGLQKLFMNQQSDLQKLGDAHQALQVQYMEQQKWLQQLLDQKGEAQGMEIACRDWSRLALPRPGNCDGVGVSIGRWMHSACVSMANGCRWSKVFVCNALRPYPFVYKVMRSIWRGFRKSVRRLMSEERTVRKPVP